MLLAIDPGGTTGLAVLFSGGQWMTATTSTPEELYDMINPSYHTIIIETFQANKISAYGLYTVRLVGGVEALTYVQKIPLVKHMPIKRHPYQRHAEYMLQSFQHVIHEADALAHLLTYMHIQKMDMTKMHRDNYIGVPKFNAQGRVTGFTRMLADDRKD